MEKYHISPKTGRPNQCDARKRPCPLPGAVEHYPTREAALEAIEKKAAEENSVTPQPLKKVSKKDSRAALILALQKETSVNVDGKLADFYYEQEKARAQVAVNKGNIARGLKRLEEYRNRGVAEDHPNVQTYFQSIAKLEEDNRKLEARVEVLEVEAEPYNAEFERRGGWPRAFLVSNGNGHVHKDMSCSTCLPTTRYQWMTNYSGKSEDEIVDDAGERACTVCYPSAPVSSLNKPTKMFTDDEVRAAEAREERARVRAEKVAKAKASGIFEADGGPLTVPGYGGRREVVKTERAAQIMAVDSLASLLRYERWEKEGLDYNRDSKAEALAKVEILIPALARKRGLSVEEVRADLDARAKKK